MSQYYRIILISVGGAYALPGPTVATPLVSSNITRLRTAIQWMRVCAFECMVCARYTHVITQQKILGQVLPKIPKILHSWARSFKELGKILQLSRNKCRVLAAIARMQEIIFFLGKILQLSRNKCRVLASMARLQEIIFFLGKILARSYSCQEINAASWLQWQDCKN